MGANTLSIFRQEKGKSGGMSPKLVDIRTGIRWNKSEPDAKETLSSMLKACSIRHTYTKLKQHSIKKQQFVKKNVITA